MVVTTIVLPLETERYVEGVSKGVGVGLDDEVVKEVEEDVEPGGRLETDVVEGGTEVDEDC